MEGVSSDARDAALVVVAGVSIFAAQQALQRFVFLPLAARLGISAKGEEVARKFADEAWCLLWHSALLVWELCAVPTGQLHAALSPWTAPGGGTAVFWDPSARMSATLRYLYLVQLGYYLYDLTYLYFFDRDKKNFAMYLSHHIAALLLILTSYFPPPCRFVFIGSAILLLHEVSDVFLYAAKVAKFLELRTTTHVMFALATLSWGFLRVLNFPRIIWSAHAESVERSPRQQLCVFMLSVLFVLHCHWFRLLLEVLHRAVTGSGLDDPTRPDVAREREQLGGKEGKKRKRE